MFPEEAGLPQADITVQALTEIDAPLLAAFRARVAATARAPASEPATA